MNIVRRCPRPLYGCVECISLSVKTIGLEPTPTAHPTLRPYDSNLRPQHITLSVLALTHELGDARAALQRARAELRAAHANLLEMHRRVEAVYDSQDTHYHDFSKDGEGHTRFHPRGLPPRPTLTPVTCRNSTNALKALFDLFEVQ